MLKAVKYPFQVIFKNFFLVFNYNLFNVYTNPIIKLSDTYENHDGKMKALCHRYTKRQTSV